MVSLVDETGDGEAVMGGARGLGESFIVVEARLWLVGAECEPFDLYLCGGRHVGRVELISFWTYPTMAESSAVIRPISSGEDPAERAWRPS